MDIYIKLGEPVENTMPSLEDHMMQKWESQMQDFQPEDMISFEIEAGSNEVLFEDIPNLTKIRGAFFIPMYIGEQKIDFTIKTPSNKILHFEEKVQEGLFNIDIPETGEYKFIFNNKRVTNIAKQMFFKSKDSTIVTFAIDIHNSTADHLQHHDINPFTGRLDRIHQALRDNYFENKFGSMRQEEGYQVLNSTHQKLMVFTVFETLGIIAVNFWQVLYIKRILGNQRLI